MIPRRMSILSTLNQKKLELKMNNYLIDHMDENKRLDFQNKIDVYNLDDELDFFKWDKSHKILDAGCGNGNVVEKLLKKGMTQIHGVDLSSDRIAQVTERFNGHNGLNFFQAHLHETGLLSDEYDQIICRYVFEHVTNPHDILKEFYRILKPKAFLNIINFDDIFFNFYTKNSNFNKQLKELKNRVPQDFEIARKLPHYLKENNFKDVIWDAKSYFFKGERLKMEIENNKMRLEQGKSHLSKYFSSVTEYEQFAKTYIDEMKDDCNVLSVTKFLINAHK